MIVLLFAASGQNIESIRIDSKIETKEDFDVIVQKIGNKILLEEDINKGIGNEWFKLKKQSSIKEKRGYKDSSFGIAQHLTDFPRDLWTKEDIEQYTHLAAKRIIKFIYAQENNDCNMVEK